MRAPIGPGLAPDRAIAALAGLIGLPVGIELLGEIAGFSVDVLILLVKAGTPLGYRLLKHFLDDLHELIEFGL